MVADVSSNRKPLCDFLLVNILYPISYLTPFTSYRSGEVKLSPSLKHSLVLANPYEHHHKSCCLKLDSLDYIFVADITGLSSTSLT